MATENDDELPPEVQAEVDKARREGGEEPPEVEVERAAIPAGDGRPLSRRQQAEQERMAQIEAANRRSEAAEKIAEELRAARAADSERFARMEQALEFVARQRQEAPPPQHRQEAPAPSVDEQVKKLRRDANDALGKNDIDAFHDANEQIARVIGRAEADSRVRAAMAQMPQPQQPQIQKPAWVSAVEAQHGDVLMNPRGLNTVAAFLGISDEAFGPEKLDKAFKRAREELGLAKRKDETNERQRAMLSGGPTNGTTRSNGKSKPQARMPAGWQEAARKAGMSKEDYIRAHVEMHPEDVVRE